MLLTCSGVLAEEIRWATGWLKPVAFTSAGFTENQRKID